MSNRAQELIYQADSLRTHNDLTSQLSNLSLLLYEQLIKTGYAKSDLEFREITKFFYEKMPKLDIENSDSERSYGILRLMFGIAFWFKTFFPAINILASGSICLIKILR